MKLNLTLGAIESFEDQIGVGLLGMFDGSETDIKSRWTIRRLRAIAAATGATQEQIDDWLQMGRLIESQTDAIVQLMDQLTPPAETSEYLNQAGEAGESVGNSLPDAG